MDVLKQKVDHLAICNGLPEKRRTFFVEFSSHNAWLNEVIVGYDVFIRGRLFIDACIPNNEGSCK